MKIKSPSYIRPLIGQKEIRKISAIRIRPSHANGHGSLSPHHPLCQETAPLCTFGPGGEYVVDWFAGRGRLTTTLEKEKAALIPASVGAGEASKSSNTGHKCAEAPSLGITPLRLLSDEFKKFFIGDHPGRIHRSDEHPHWLAPCRTCGQHSQYSPWIVHRGFLSRPRSAIMHLGVTAAERVDLSGARPFASSGPSLTEVSDQLFPEMIYESNTQTTQTPAGDRRLASTGGLFTDDAGIGRSTRRVESHRFRARTGAGAKRASGSTEAQGSLFEPQSTS